MNHRSKFRTIRTHLAVFVPAALAFALVTTDAGAVYSGTIARTLCPGASMVPTNADRNYWDNATAAFACGAKVTDPAAPTAFRYTRVSIPFERGSAGSHGTTSVTPTVYATGGNSGSGQVCAAFYSTTTAGALSGSSGTLCTTGALTPKTLPLTAIAVGPDQGTLFSIAAQHQGELSLVKIRWDVAGS